MKWYLKVLKQFADFKGRARRTEYWMFVLFNMIIGGILGALDNLLGLGATESGGGLLSGLYGLFVLVPGIAVAVRRLHDIGKSGWWLLLVLLPIIGWIWLFVLYVTDSTPGNNEYGPNPKGA